MKRSKRYSVSLGPALASGWNWVEKHLGRLYFSPSQLPSFTLKWEISATAGSTVSERTA